MNLHRRMSTTCQRIAAVILFLFSTAANSQEVTPDEARTVAFHFATQRLGNTFAPVFTETHTGEYNHCITYYTFNLFPEGFVVVSANRATVPVLAYSETGFCPQQSENQAHQWWMEQYSSQIYLLAKQKKQPTPAIKKLWDDYLSGMVGSTKAMTGPLLSSKWNQGAYYNEQCPADPQGPDGKCVTGCVATAIGQLMNYFRWPQSGEGSYTSQDTVYGTLSVDYSAAEYNFNEMANSLTRTNPETAELIYNIGVGVDMHYGPDGSGMNNHKAAHVMKTFFKYADSTQYVFRDSVSLDWDSLLISFLDRGLPMYYAGWSDTNYVMGHAFVVDGYQDSCFFHFNWGWGGSADAYYYYTSNLTPPGNNFNLMHELVINMYPEGPYPLFCNGADTLTARDGTLDDGSGPLFGYRNDASCSWLIAPDDSATAIKLTFLRFETESANDILTVYNGSDQSAPVLGSYSGSSLPPVLQSNGNRMFITFTSNAADTAGGFLASYSIVTPASFCTSMVTLTAESDSIEDGSGPYDYHGNNFCRWKIEPASGEPMLLTFTEFDLDSTDYVKVTDHTTNALLGEFRGNQLPPVLFSSNGTMTITLKTTATAHAQGFKCFYRTSPVSVADMSAPELLLFPNPASGYIHLEGAAENSTIKIYDTQGRCVFETTLAEGQTSALIPVYPLNDGMYMLSCTAKDYGKTLRFYKESR